MKGSVVFMLLVGGLTGALGCSGRSALPTPGAAAVEPPVAASVVPVAAPVVPTVASVAPTAAGHGFLAPMEVGRVWVYAGKVRWTDEKAEVHEQPLRWRVKTLALLRRGGQVVAQLDRWLSALDWYQPGQEPKPVLLVEEPDFGLVLFEGESVQVLWARLLAQPQDRLTRADLQTGELLATAALKKDAVWGDAESLAREDGMYARRVTEVGLRDLHALTGWTGVPQASAFTISMRTNADQLSYELVPGLGFTRHSYEHHGTVSGCEVELVAIDQE